MDSSERYQHSPFTVASKSAYSTSANFSALEEVASGHSKGTRSLTNRHSHTRTYRERERKERKEGCLVFNRPSGLRERERED